MVIMLLNSVRVTIIMNLPINVIIFSGTLSMLTAIANNGGNEEFFRGGGEEPKTKTIQKGNQNTPFKPFG